MLPNEVARAANSSARAAIRLATHDKHQLMHSLAPFERIAAGTLLFSCYGRLLQSLFVFHSAVGQAAGRAGWSHLSSAETRLDLLRSDLVHLGCRVPTLTKPWQAGPGEAILGALYAAEGSMIGGRVIARQLSFLFGTEQQGRRFFIGNENDRVNWSRLIKVLEETCAHSRQLNLAVDGALRTFDLFQDCVDPFKRGHDAPDPHEH